MRQDRKKKCTECGTDENVAAGKGEKMCYDCWENLRYLVAGAREDYLSSMPSASTKGAIK